MPNACPSRACATRPPKARAIRWRWVVRKRRTSPCGGRSGSISNPGMAPDEAGGASGAGISAAAGLGSGMPSYRFRPYCSWLDTQSSEEIAEASEISPASTTPAMISASFLHLAAADAAEDLQALALGGEAGAAAVGGHDQRRDGDRDVEVLLRRHLGVDDAGRRLGDVRHVLAGGDEHRRDAVRRVAAVVVGAREEGADVGDAGVVVEGLGVDPHVLDQHVARDRRLGGHPLAAGAHDVDLRRLLVGREVRLQVEVADLVVVLQDPGAGGEGGAAHHVLAGGVAGGVVEAQEDQLVRQVAVDVR